MIAGALVRYDFIRNLISPNNTALEVLALSYKRSGDEEKLMEAILSEIKDKLQEDSVKASISCLTGKNMVDSILTTGEQKDADLIVISSSVDVTSKHFFVGPNSQRILHGAKVPIIYVKRVGIPTIAG